MFYFNKKKKKDNDRLYSFTEPETSKLIYAQTTDKTKDTEGWGWGEGEGLGRGEANTFFRWALGVNKRYLCT